MNKPWFILTNDDLPHGPSKAAMDKAVAAMEKATALADIAERAKRSICLQKIARERCNRDIVRGREKQIG